MHSHVKTRRDEKLTEKSYRSIFRSESGVRKSKHREFQTGTTAHLKLLELPGSKNDYFSIMRGILTFLVSFMVIETRYQTFLMFIKKHKQLTQCSLILSGAVKMTAW